MNHDITTVQRVFRRHSPFHLTEQVCAQALDRLADAVAEHGPVAAVVGIAGGGRLPAEHLASRLRAPCCHVRAQHNPSDALYTQATGEVTVEIPHGFPALGGRVLLVDDICGTGATFTAAAHALTPYLAATTRVETAAVCRNIGAALCPTWWAYDVDDWVVFPWEPTPTDRPLRTLPALEEIHTA